MKYMNIEKIINYYKWEALNSFFEKKNTSEEKKKKKRSFACPPPPSWVDVGPQSVYVSRALCIIVLRSQSSDLSAILRSLKKGQKKEIYF